jgi:lipopolysaccharide export system permease protein
MRSLQRYLLRQLALATVVAAVSITAMIAFTQWAPWIRLAVAHSSGSEIMLRLTAILVPSFLIISLPISVLLAVAFVYNKMIGDHEIVVMRAAGLSNVELAAPALLLSGVVSAIVFSVSLYFMPITMREARNTIFSLRAAPTLLFREGIFNDVKPGLTLFFKNRREDGVMTDVLIFDTRDQARSTMLMARQAFLKMGERQARIVLIEGSRQERDNKRGTVEYLNFDRADLRLDMGPPPKRSKSHYATSEKFVWQLLDPANALDDPQRRIRDMAAGHSRLAAPLFSISFVLIALAAVLAPGGGRFGNKPQFLAAAAAIGVVQAGAFGTTALAEAFPATAPLIYLNVLLPALAGYVLLRRFDKRAGSPFRVSRI